MPGKVYSVFIGENALDKDKELLNPKKRTQGIPPDETLISCKYDMALNSAGSCTFTMPPKHPYILEIKPMITEVAVAEIDNIVWFGRVTDTKTDFYGRLQVHCEGAYAYLNDSVQLYEEYYGLDPKDYLAKLIANHNAQVPENRQISLAFAKDGGDKLYGKLSYDSTMSLVQRFLDECGGYIYVLMSPSGKSDLYWIDSRNLASSQTVKFGKNLLDLAKTVDYADICTAIIPLGADVEMEVPDLDEEGNQLYEDANGKQSTTQDETYATPSVKVKEFPLNLGMVEDTSAESEESSETDEDDPKPVRFKQETTDISDLCIDGPNVATYGRIVRSVTFNEVYDTTALRAKAETWLAKQELGGVTIDISAADLRFLDPSEGNFYLGMAVPVDSAPHDVTETLIITKIEADIVKVNKKITLGRLPDKTLSDIAGRGKNNYEVGRELKKTNSKKKVKAKDSGVWFIPK